MSVIWFKRFRMNYSLLGELPAPPRLESGYELWPWTRQLLGRHAEAKYYAFRHEIDANVFPCLADRDGCRELMRDISRRAGFVAPATWLAVCRDSDTGAVANCGTVQGMVIGQREGSIQNLGVVPNHRGHGLARALLVAALEGFRAHGMAEASLEVTACNEYAIRLYQQFGFRISRTVYKSIELHPAAEAVEARRPATPPAAGI
jgi:ribosomal protein S18 acetylase RimI-like enzyme